MADKLVNTRFFCLDENLVHQRDVFRRVVEHEVPDKLLEPFARYIHADGSLGTARQEITQHVARFADHAAFKVFLVSRKQCAVLFP